MTKPGWEINICRICLTTSKTALGLIDIGKVQEGRNHLAQLVKHIETWQNSWLHTNEGTVDDAGNFHNSDS